MPSVVVRRRIDHPSRSTLRPSVVPLVGRRARIVLPAATLATPSPRTDRTRQTAASMCSARDVRRVSTHWDEPRCSDDPWGPFYEVVAEMGPDGTNGPVNGESLRTGVEIRLSCQHDIGPVTERPQGVVHCDSPFGVVVVDQALFGKPRQVHVVELHPERVVVFVSD